MVKAADYAYAAGKVKALEARLLDPSALQRMIDAPDFEEALRFVGEGGYSGMLTRSGFEKALAMAVREANEDVASFSPDPYFTGMFYARYDFLALKAELKRLLMQKAGMETPDATAKEAGWITAFEVEQVAHEAVGSVTGWVEPSEFSGEKPETELEELMLALRKAAYDAVRRYEASGHDPQEIDNALDKAYFNYLSGMAASRKAAWAAKMVQLMADTSNALTLMRAFTAGKDPKAAAAALVPGGAVKLDSLEECAREGEPRLRSLLESSDYWKACSAEFELWTKDSALRPFEMAASRLVGKAAREARAMTEGYTPVMGYLLMKEREASALRAILAGKARNLAPRTIRERLSEGDA